MLITCAFCSRQAAKASGAVNRSLTKGAPLYCSRTCSGLARRVHKSKTQKAIEKAEYDRKRRAVLGDDLRAKKREAYHALVASNPGLVRAREKVNRTKRKDAHAEYCRRPEYREWKAAYDQQHRARKFFGDFGEAAIMLNALEREIAARATRTEIYRANGILNKTIERKRDYARKTGNPFRS